METKKVARLVQPNGSNCADHSQVPRASGKARSVRTARATRHGSAVVAVACSLAVVATSIAPMAAASGLRRERSTVANNAVDPQLARLHETRGVGLGIVLGTENFLRVSPVTAVAKNDGPVATDNGVDAQLAARKSATVRAGDKVSRALSQVVAEEEHLGTSVRGCAPGFVVHRRTLFRGNSDGGGNVSGTSPAYLAFESRPTSTKEAR